VTALALKSGDRQPMMRHYLGFIGILPGIVGREHVFRRLLALSVAPAPAPFRTAYCSTAEEIP